MSQVLQCFFCAIVSHISLRNFCIHRFVKLCRITSVNEFSILSLNLLGHNAPLPVYCCALGINSCVGEYLKLIVKHIKHGFSLKFVFVFLLVAHCPISDISALITSVEFLYHF